MPGMTSLPGPKRGPLHEGGGGREGEEGIENFKIF